MLNYTRTCALKSEKYSCNILLKKFHEFQELESIKDKSSLPPLLHCHGTRDELVLFDWGKTTFKTLTELGVSGEFHQFNVFHEFNKKELTLIREWILDKLPPESRL